MDSVRPARSGPEGSPFRYLLLRASRPASLRVPGVTAAAARQLLLLALLHTWPPGRCALPHRAVCTGRLLPRREDWVWTRPEAKSGAMIGTWDGGRKE